MAVAIVGGKAFEALELHILSNTHSPHNAALLSLLLSVLFPTVHIYVDMKEILFSGANLSIDMETLVYKLLDSMVGHA